MSDSNLPDFDPYYGIADLPDFDPRFGVEDTAATKSGKVVQRVGDVALSLAKGVVGVPQAVTGIADLATVGKAGKAAEEAGIRFKDAQNVLAGLQSPEQQAANAEVANADGFFDTVKASIDNPSTIVNSVAESLPAMGAGGVIARGGIGAAGLISRGLAEKSIPIMAGLGEGAVTAGQIAEQVRSENPDKLLTDKQALAATGAGIVTGGIGAAAAKLVNTKFGQRLGLADMDMLIAKGGPDAVTASAAKTGFIKSLLSSGFSEGVLEELPQSAQEQMWQNYAQGKPVTEGVGNAAATGLMAGAAMGGAGGGYNALMRDKKPDTKIAVEAGNEILQGQQDLHQGQDAQAGANQTPETNPVTPEAVQAIPGDVSAAVDRLSELEIQAEQGGLTPEQQAEYQALAQTINQNSAQQDQETITPEAAQPETQPTGAVQPAESPVSPVVNFQPTHQLDDGTLVKLTEDFDGNPVFEDAQGNWTDFDNTAEPINATNHTGSNAEAHIGAAAIDRRAVDQNSGAGGGAINEVRSDVPGGIAGNAEQLPAQINQPDNIIHRGTLDGQSQNTATQEASASQALSDATIHGDGVPPKEPLNRSIPSAEQITPEYALREIGRLSDEAMGGNHPAMPQQSLANGDFAGSGKLNMDSAGNVVLTRVASSEDHLSKDWQDISGEELINTSLSHGGGRGIPTSGISSWGKSYGATHGGDRVIGTFKIPLQDLLSAIRNGNAILGNIGEGEIVLNPAFAESYLASVTDTDGNPVTRKQDSITLPSDITDRNIPAAGGGAEQSAIPSQEKRELSKDFIPAGTVLSYVAGNKKRLIRVPDNLEIPNSRDAWVSVEIDNGYSNGFGKGEIPADSLRELVFDAIKGKADDGDVTNGAWTIEQRKQNAAKSFIDSAIEQFELSPQEAQRSLEHYQRNNLISLNGATGQFQLRHGNLWDAYPLRLAAYKEKFPDASGKQLAALENAANAQSRPVRDSYLREAETLNVAASKPAKPAKPAKNNLTSPPTGNEEIQVAIRKLGGIKREGMADRAGFTDFKSRKYTGLFNNGQNAKTFDEMAELLRGYGYHVDGENDLIEKLYASLNGQPHYSPIGAERYAEKLFMEAAKAEQEQLDYENAMEAIEKSAAIQAIDDIQPDEEYDEIFETVLSNDRRNVSRITNLDDIFGPETKSVEEGAGAADTGTAVRRTIEGGDQTRNAVETDREGQKQQRSKLKGGDEKGDQGNEQAGSRGISEEAHRAAELFKANPQKVVNELTARGAIKPLYDAANVMTSAAFKDLPIADKVAAYVKMTTGETIPGAPKPKGAPVETDLFVNSEEERKALEAKQGAANVAAAKDKKRQGNGEEPAPLFSDNPAMAGQVDIEDAAHEAATSPKNDLPEPTQAQKEAGNYKKGHITLQGLDITIENPQGSTRSGVDSNGKPWSVDMANHYGYIKRTEGADGDHVDVFIGPNPASKNVFIVNQIDPRTNQFDEHKVMLGFNTEAEARDGYLANYAKGWKGIGSIARTSIDQFKTTLASGVLDKPIKQPLNTNGTETEDENGSQPWKMSREEFEKANPDRKEGTYDSLIHSAWMNDKVSTEQKDKLVIRNSMGAKEFWAKTRKEIEQEGNQSATAARKQRAAENKNPLYGAKWADKSNSLKNKKAIDDAKRYTDQLLSVHKERVQEALQEGKPVPKEVLADYPDLQSNKQPTETKASGEVSESQANSDQAFGKRWDAMDYAGKQEIAKASKLSWNRNIVHRVSGSKWSQLGDLEKQDLIAASSQLNSDQANDKRQSEDSKKTDSDANQIPASWESPTIEDDGRWFGTVIEKKPEFKKEQPTQGKVHRVYRGSSTGIIEFQPDGTDSIFRLRPDQISKVIKLVDNKSTGELPKKSTGEADQEKTTIKSRSKSEVREGDLVETDNSILKITKFPSLKKSVGGFQSVDFRVIKTKDINGKWNDYQGKPRNETVGSFVHLFGVYPVTVEVPEKSTEEVDQAKLDQERFKDNKIFTADKVAAARERLKAKLGTLNSGFDPELALDGMTIAGAYIESGIKAYADYTKAMIADLGEGVRPYLRSFYESVRAYPGMDKTGMTSHAELEAADRYGVHHGEMWSFDGKPEREVSLVNEHRIGFKTKDDAGKYDVSIGNFSQQKNRWKKVEDNSGKKNPPIENPAPVIGEQPKVEKQKFDPLGNLKLKADWGVEHIDGYDSDRDDGKGGKIKTEFLNNTKKYLNQVADLLSKKGFTPYTDKKGKTEKPVSANEGGPAFSGDVSLAMRKGNNGIYIQVGVSFVRVNGKSHPQGVAMVARVTNNANKGRYATDGINQWLPWDTSTADLAKWAITQIGRLEDNAKFKEAQDYAKRPQNAEQAPVETGNGEKDRSPWGDSQPDSGSMGVGLAEADQETGNTGNTDSGNQKASGTRAGSGRVRAPKQLDGGNRGKADSGRRSESGSTESDSVSLPSEPKADFTATAETAEAITEGGQKTKARANIAAIKLVKQLVAEDRRATMDEQKALARYVGWGGIKQIFDTDNTAWSSLRNELKAILTAEEYAAANRSILDAHYTGLDVVNGMWGIAKHLGFKGGRLLEPSMGVGNFFGAMPHDMRVNSTLFGVELDNITGAIAKYLYPNARINTPVGFQEVDIPANSFDFATGNPPFGEHSLYDKNHPEFRSYAIHQFFFAKTLNTLRPGGIQAFVVSRYLMDSRDGNGMAARKYLSENARLVGAMRLPYDAFLSNANTEVVTDIIILQKLAPGEQGNADEWTSMTDINVVHPDGTPSTFSINKYFSDHPEMVLGTHSNTGKMRAKYQYNVEPIAGESLQFSIEKATKHLPKDIYKSAEKPLAELAMQADEVPEGTKVYGFFMDGDTVMQRVPDSMGNRQAVQVEFKDAKSPARAKGLIQLRDALRDLMRTELSRTASNKEIEAKRATLNQVYDAFVKEHGFVNRDVNRRVMRDDPDYPLLESLEPNYDPGIGVEAARKKGEKERKPSADKADIFRERVLYPFQTLDKAETAKDALIASLNEKGGVDQDFMAEIYGKPWESIESELGELIYQNPAGGYETADAYLSGNVKAKLKLAEESAKENPAYQRNVEALKAVQPADIPALNISVRLGSPWVDSAAMADFAKELFGKRTNASIRFVPQIAKWIVSIEDFDPVARVSVWGTQRMPANELLEHILNNKPIVVKDNLGTSREPQWVVNETETESARAKAQDMSAKFKEWIWQDQERRDRLAKTYNQNYNTDKRRSYDGSHLTLPGSSNNINLRPHQKNAIWRALQDRTILLDQVVGAGKTFIMAGIAMEMRRLGIARKPMFMVPNSLVRQWRDEFYKLYPNANVLAATENDFAKVNRKRFMAKIATGDWDAVVVAHSSFKKIGMPEVQERKILDEKLKEIADVIEEMKRERGDKNVMRDMQRIKEKLEEKLKALNDRGGKKDDTVSFDELGVDALFLDEAHLFKNLFYISGMRNIAGLGNPSGSGRAFDLFVKTQFLAENYAGKAPIVFATGTPVSNSLVEMFTMQRYLAWSKLKDANIHLLDAWAGVYGDVQNVYEVHPSGTGYRLSTRFAKFVNLPSLMNLYRGFADIITMDDLKKQAIDRGEKFPVPKVKGGKPTLVVAPRSDLQTRFFGEPEFVRGEGGGIQFKYNDSPSLYEATVSGDGKWRVIKADTKGAVSQTYDTKEEAEEDLERGLVTPEVAWNENSILWKFENLKKLTKDTNGRINALSITNEARKAGLDYRLINPAAPDFKDSKVNKAVENVLRIYKEWTQDKGTQLVFCDLSVPQSAKAAAANSERDAFVRREGGELRKVKATIAQIDGMDRAFLVVKMGKKEETRFMVYDGVTGADLEIEGATRAEAVKALTDASNNDLSFADKFEQFAPIEDSDIADWKDANSKDDGDDEEGDGAISMDELLSMGSTNKFSVYDDIKAKLIKKGIPEKEIAFIHDYDTAVKKGKLFDMVNAGDIRVLIGSTEKMGAGMNVQKRLVGLHHLDAPWRPSDLEQREGRIIRQGNELYKRDPDNFEVEIMRYGTKQTYDTRMWQIIEHKAAGVEQLRKANDDMLEIDDVGGEAANAADMKAAASGNPLILDEIKLRNEVKSLESQQFGHMQAQVELQDKLKEYKNAPQVERERLAGIKPVLDVRDANPAKPFRFIDSDGVSHEEYKEAEAPLTKAMIAAAKGSKGFGFGTVIEAGKYRGFDVTFERGAFGVQVVISTQSGNVLNAAYYGPDDKFSVTGLISRLDNALSKLDDQIERLKTETKDKLDQIPAIEKELGKPFAKEDQLKDARAKHRNVVNQLAKSGGGIELTDAMKKELEAALAARGLGKKSTPVQDEIVFVPGYGPMIPASSASNFDNAELVDGYGFMIPVSRSDTRLSIGKPSESLPNLVSLFESMGKRSSKSVTINHPQAALIRAIQDGGWQDVLLQVGYEKADKSDNPNGKVFIQC